MRAAWPAVVLALAAASCRGGRSDPPGVSDLRLRHARLQARFAAALQHNAAATEVLGREGQVIVSLPTRLLEACFQEVAQRYLDSVTVDLSTVRAVAHGEVHKRTLLGRLRAGYWRAEFTMERLRGMLEARRPRVRTAGNAIHFDLPVHAREARGAVTVRFLWDGSGVAQLLCRDFELSQSLEGRVRPGEHRVEGMFELAAEPERIVARPRFPRREFALKIDLTPESWAAVERALRSQDQLFRCGIPLKPEKVLAQLHALAERGISVKLPDSIFRTVQMPTGAQPEVAIDGRRVALSVRTRTLWVASRSVWSSMSVHVLRVVETPAD